VEGAVPGIAGIGNAAWPNGDSRRNGAIKWLITIDVPLEKKHPYQRAFLPVNRLEDGTMWNW
jgi:mannonate dehydratase